MNVQQLVEKLQALLDEGHDVAKMPVLIPLRFDVLVAPEPRIVKGKVLL